MRKPLLSFACLLVLAGLSLAMDATLVKFDPDKKELTVKADGKEITYKLGEKVKVTFINNDGTAKEGTIEAAVKVLSNEKSKGRKLDVVADKDTVTALRIPRKKN